MWQPERTVITHLRKLSGIRERLLNAKKQISNIIKEDKKFIGKGSSAQRMKCYKQSIKALEEDIKKTEKEIKKVIDNDKKLRNFFQLLNMFLVLVK